MNIFTKISCIICIFTISIFAQQASDYFPSDLGFKWNYKVSPLDSLNNPMENFNFFRADSFAAENDFMGKSAKIVLSKMGSLDILPILPYTDTLYNHFENSDGYEYIQGSSFSSIIGILDSTGLDSTLNFLDFFNSFKGWYDAYKFSSNTNQNYTIFSKDTSITLGGNSFPLRFEYIGSRLNDETINTEIGDFNCKKFLLKLKVSYIFIPPITFELFQTKDSVWIAPSNWIVKDYMPSTNVDLSSIGFGSFYIPGLLRTMYSPVTSVSENQNIVSDYSLDQNYPNPFNPSTIIKYTLEQKSFVKLSVFDLLGRKVAELVNQEQSKGIHSAMFNAVNLSSGIYFYKIDVFGKDNSNSKIFTKTQKMILEK